MQLMWLLGFILLLAVLSIFDIRTKKIPIAGFISIYIYSALYLFFSGECIITLDGLLISLIPGLILAVLSFITEGKIGMGDALLTVGLGIGLGIERVSYTLAAALILICIFGLYMIFTRKMNRGSQIPFVPFITLGMGVMGFVFR